LPDKQDAAALFKKELKFPAAFGDWTAYKPPKDKAKKIKPLAHGFRRISREQLEETLKIHHYFAFEFSKYLKEAIKASTDIFSVSIEQLTYLDFLKRVSQGLIYNKLPIKEVGEVIFLIDYQLANIVINFSLGSQSVDTKIKELTELEESIIHSVFDNILNKYTSCWKNIFEMPKLEIISYPSIQRETHINLNEIITVVSTQISIANSVPASFTFVYQNSILKKLTELLLKKEEKMPLNFSLLSDELLNSIEVPIIVQLGTTNIAAKELPNIEVDDVISLDQKLNVPIKLILGYSSELKAQPGVKNDHLASRILGGGVKRIQSAAVARPEKETAEAEENLEETPSKEEEDIELPLEAEEKEEYNEATEGLFEEENEKPQP
jgi:flagellar motor switch protein FliM